MLATRLVRAASSTSTIASAAAGASKLLRGKTSTDLTGLAVHPSPFSALDETYKKTLSFLETLPKESVYRQATSAVTNARLASLNETLTRHRDALQAGGTSAEGVEEAIKEFEQAVDAGQIEEVLVQAQDELKLAAKMLEWKSHEPLQVTPHPRQWVYFDMAEEASTNE